MPWTKFGSILGPQGLQGEVSVDPNTVTGAASTPAMVEDLDARPTHAQLKFTIPQGIQGLQGEVAVGTTTTLAPGSPATVTDSDARPTHAVLDFGVPEGHPATATAGATTTGAAGTQAAVTNVGTTRDAIFDFVIPQGVQGVQGEVSVVATNTLAAGAPATVTDSDARPTHAALTFGIPQGIQGIQGIQGLQGEVAVDSTVTGAAGSQALVEDLDPSINKALLRFTIPKGDKGDQGIQGPGGIPGGPAGGDLGGTYPDPTVVKSAGPFTANGNVTVIGPSGETHVGEVWSGYTGIQTPPIHGDPGAGGAVLLGAPGNPQVYVISPSSISLRPQNDAAKATTFSSGLVTFAAPVELPHDPQTALQAATKQFVDTHPWIFDPGVKQLAAGTDLNLVTATGFYDVLNPANKPSGTTNAWWFLEVMRHSNDAGFAMQRATTLDLNPPAYPITFVRRSATGSWGPWERQASASGFVAKSGDIMTGGLEVTNTGTGGLKIKPGTQDTAYISFNARTSAPETQSGFLGFAGAASAHMEIRNSISDGNIKLTTTGTGRLVLSGDATGGLHAVTKQQMDAADTLRVLKSGDTMTGPLTLPAAAPSAAEHAASKAYVDARVMYGTTAPPAQVAPAGTIYCQYT